MRPYARNSSSEESEVTYKLKFHQRIGKGAYGDVYLVKSYQHGHSQFFALKILSKFEHMKKKSYDKVNRELDIMRQLDHPNITKLIDAFQTPKKICFLIEFTNGYDLWTIQNTVKKKSNYKFTEVETRFIAVQVSKALIYMHDMNIIYRDVKTENIIVNNSGHLKLVDFGFAKVLDKTHRTYTLCGTPDYLAPEIILHRPYTYSADWWSFGILIYELMTGITPFTANENANDARHCAIDQLTDIVHKPIFYPAYFTSSLIILLASLLQKDPKLRVGHIRGEAAELYSYKWFQQFNWAEFKNNDYRLDLKLDIIKYDIRKPPSDLFQANNGANEFKNIFPGFRYVPARID